MSGIPAAPEISRRTSAQRLAGNGGPLASLRPERLLAIGESQSAAFLVTYINAIDPLERLYWRNSRLRFDS